MGHAVLKLAESQWKLRQQLIRIFQWRENPCRTNNSIRRKINPKEQDCECEAHHFRFPPNLVKLLFTSRKEKVSNFRF